MPSYQQYTPMRSKDMNQYHSMKEKKRKEKKEKNQTHLPPSTPGGSIKVLILYVLITKRKHTYPIGAFAVSRKERGKDKRGGEISQQNQNRVQIRFSRSGAERQSFYLLASSGITHSALPYTYLVLYLYTTWSAR